MAAVAPPGAGPNGGGAALTLLQLLTREGVGRDALDAHFMAQVGLSQCNHSMGAYQSNKTSWRSRTS